MLLTCRTDPGLLLHEMTLAAMACVQDMLQGGDAVST